MFDAQTLKALLTELEREGVRDVVVTAQTIIGTSELFEFAGIRDGKAVNGAGTPGSKLVLDVTSPQASLSVILLISAWFCEEKSGRSTRDALPFRIWWNGCVGTGAAVWQLDMLSSAVKFGLSHPVNIFNSDHMALPPNNLNTKLACAGTVILLAWVTGLYLAFLPMAIPGLPGFLTAGLLEWLAFVIAIAASAFAFRYLYLAARYRGVAWWAYVMGFFPAILTFAIAVLFGGAIFSCTTCGGSRSAVFQTADDKSIVITRQSSHPYLAEYDRKLTLETGRTVLATKLLAMDTGGYASANLYRCATGAYLLDSYGELTVIDASTGEIFGGDCPSGRTYLGIFDGGGSQPWLFIPASQRPEQELVMDGG